VHFPKWVYHRELEPKLVQSKEHWESLGKGWEDTPAAFEVPETKEPPAKKAKKKKVQE
jgi:hypothetical protein